MYAFAKKTIIALKSEIEKPVDLSEIETSPKVRARDISDREDGFYHQTDLFLSGSNEYNVNWYFLAENRLPESLQSDFETVMQTLVRLGIGGERSSGCGNLKEHVVADFKPGIENTKYRASLSLIAPNENELTENALYQVVKRGGRFLEKGKSLPMIQMLSEGAVFDTDIKGRIVELNAEPPVLRYGLNLDIPLHDNFIKGMI